MSRYVVQFEIGGGTAAAAIVAGAQGLTVVDWEISTTASSGSTVLSVTRNNSLGSGTLQAPPQPLHEGDVAALSTVAVYASVGYGYTLGRWALPSGIDNLRLFRQHPVYMEPGSNIGFIVGGTSANIELTVYFEE